MGKTAVQVKVVEDLAMIAAPLPQVKASDRWTLHNLLRATYTLDTYKLCCDKDKDFLIVAEIPHSLATAEVLERFIRGCIELVDARLDTYRSFEQVQHIVASVQARTAFGVLLGFLTDEIDLDGSVP
jgi:spore coat polysaccharide biosynthesis protein SpsF (cytidylyltransferase family)